MSGGKRPFVLSALTIFTLHASTVAEDPRDSDRAADPQPLFSSEVITARTRGHAVDIDVDITGARQLYLVATDAGDGINCDFANWVRPRFVTPDGDVKLTELEWERTETTWGQVRVGRHAEGGPLRVDGKRPAGRRRQ